VGRKPELRFREQLLLLAKDVVEEVPRIEMALRPHHDRVLSLDGQVPSLGGGLSLHIHEGLQWQ